MVKERILSYDIFRGVLLIAMVIFHVLVNLTSLQFNQEFFYWVPMGFIMFLGIILGQFLRHKSSQKITLALKLLFIFLILNIHNFFTKDFQISSLIKGDPTLFSFEILFPMSILIFSTFLFDHLKEKWKVCLTICLLLLFILNAYNIFHYNFSFLIYGLVGYFLSMGIDLDEISQKHQNLRSISFLLLAAIILFLVQFVALYDFILFFQILALYFLSSILFKKAKFLVILGRNSLSLYVIHIIIIRAIAGYLPYV